MIKSASQSSLVNYKKYSSMLAGYTAASDYKLDEVVLTGNAASVSFDVSAHAGVYKNLQIRYVARTDLADIGDWLNIRFNGSSSGYAFHSVRGDGSSGIGHGLASSSYLTLYTSLSSASNTANVFSCGTIDFLDVFSSTKAKAVKAIVGVTSSYPRIALCSGVWTGTSAVTSIALTPYTTSNFIAGTRFALYGSN